MAPNLVHIHLNALDHLPPPNYPNTVLYLPLKDNVDLESVFSVLQEGLRRTFLQLPWLNGKVHPVSLGVEGQEQGLLEIRYQLLEEHHSTQIHQLKSNKLTTSDSYEELRDSVFPSDAFEDEALSWAPFLPDVTIGADVLVAQANFIPGACILTTAICHAVADGMGANCVLGLWAENCRNVQIGNTAQHAQLPPNISDRDLLEQTLTSQGHVLPDWDFSPEAWRLIGLEPPASEEFTGEATSGLDRVEDAAPAPDTSGTRGYMKAHVFYISSANLAALREVCLREPDSADVSLNDAICALVWRCLLKSRAAAKSVSTDSGKAVNGTDHDVGIEARLDLPFDVRPYFPEAIPPNYLGNSTMVNQARLPLSYLVSPTTSIGSVASNIRKAVAQVSTGRIMEAYALAKTLPGRDDQGPKLQNLKVDGSGLMITSVLTFQGDFCFGDKVFANGGRSEATRPLLGAINKVFRYCAILPRKSHGGVEFIANLFDDELDILLQDEEFGKYVMFMA